VAKVARIANNIKKLVKQLTLHIIIFDGEADGRSGGLRYNILLNFIKGLT
jgi:hypothetical protein